MPRKNPPPAPDGRDLVIWVCGDEPFHLHIQFGREVGVIEPATAWNIASQLISALAEYGQLPEE